MTIEEYTSIIRHLKLTFTGCEYETVLDEAIANEFQNYCLYPIVRGQKAPAAGSALNVDVVMTIALGVTSGLIVEALKAVITRIKAASTIALSRSCTLGRTTIETDGCDYVISANSNAGVHAEYIDYNNLLQEMMRFREDELAAGRHVFKIETPCDFDPKKDMPIVRNLGVGNYSLWIVEYSLGERWPFCLYDAANDALLPIDDKQIIAERIAAEDPFSEWRHKVRID